MKNIFILLLGITVGFTSCENPVSKKIKETKENVSNATKAVEEMSDLQEDIQEMQSIVPLTNDEMKAWLPDEINGMKRTAYKAGQMSYMKIANIEATYTSEDKSKKFKIEVIDGAGEIGATATAGMRILFSQDFEEEDEYKSRKTTVRNGIKAIEEYRKNNNKSTIEFMSQDRFYMKATGTGMTIDETWDAIEELDVDDLG